MNDAIWMGNQYREARLNAAKYNERLSTLEGAAEALSDQDDDSMLAPNTVGRWERGRSIPSNHKVVDMAWMYNAPHLLVNYCSTCPIGKDRISPVEEKPLGTLAIRLHNMGKIIEAYGDEFLQIAEDNVVDDDERPRFDEIVADIKRMGKVISEIELHALKLQNG